MQKEYRQKVINTFNLMLTMPGKRTKKNQGKKSKGKKSSKNRKSFLKTFRKGSWIIISGLSGALWYVLKSFGKGIAWLWKKTFHKETVKERENEKNKTRIGKKEEKQRAPVPKINLIESIKGNYSSWWKKLNDSDSTIGIVLGARGSGKTAFALALAENLRNSKEKAFAMGFSQSSMPKWIKIVENINEIENNSLVVLDEGGILFSSRNSMSTTNKMMSELLLIARHKNLTIVFISQNSSNLEVNTLRQADFLVLKKSSLLQSEFERKIISKIYEENIEGFEKYKNYKGIALVYTHDFIGFIDNELPSFWSGDISKSFK